MNIIYRIVLFRNTRCDSLVNRSNKISYLKNGKAYDPATKELISHLNQMVEDIKQQNKRHDELLETWMKSHNKKFTWDKMKKYYFIGITIAAIICLFL